MWVMPMKVLHHQQKQNRKFPIFLEQRMGNFLVILCFVLPYHATNVNRKNIQWAATAATNPPMKCAVMALGVRSR